jgi:hypothetical protein
VKVHYIIYPSIYTSRFEFGTSSLEVYVTANCAM